MTSPADVVSAQVEAYNRGDADAFADCYAEDAVVARSDGAAMMTGRETIRDMYRTLFRASPDLVAEVRSRQAVGDWVVDEEYVTGMGGHGAPPVVHALVAYQVKGGEILRAQMLT